MIKDILKPKNKEEIIEVVDTVTVSLILYFKLNRTKSINILKAFTYIASKLEQPLENLVLINNKPKTNFLVWCLDFNAIGERVHFRGGHFSHAIVYSGNLALLKPRDKGEDFVLISKETIIKNIMNL